MGWLLFGIVLAGIYGALWALLLVGDDPDDRSIRDFDRARRELEPHDR